MPYYQIKNSFNLGFEIEERIVKDTKRKIIKTVIIDIYGSLIGSKLGSSRANTGERIWETNNDAVVFETKIPSQNSLEYVVLIFELLKAIF